MQLRLRLSALVLSALLLSQSLVLAVEGPELIPASAAAVIRLQAPKTLINEAANFIDDVQPGFGGMIKGQAGMLGVGISNPTMQGVDQSRDWYAAVFLSQEKPPVVVYVIPAVDVKAMESAVSEDFEFVGKDGYGIYSEDAEAVETFRKHFETARGKSVASLASAPLKTFMGAGHISIAANLVLIKQIYQTELEDMREQFLKGVKEAQAEMPEVPGMKLDWVPGLLDQVVQKVETATVDSQAYALSLTLAESGIRLEDFWEFAPGSSSSKFLGTHPPQAMSLIGKLPAGQLAYSSIGKSITQMNVWGLSLLPKMFEMTDEQKATWAEVEKQITEIKFGSSASSFTLGDTETGLLRAITVSEASPADKLRQTSEKVASVMSGLEFPGVKQEMTFEANHEKVDGIEVDLLVTKTTVDDEEKAGGLQAQMNFMLYGPAGPETRIAYLDGLFVQTVGGGLEGMKLALETYKAGSAKDDVLARDLKPLGATNNIVGLLDLQTMLVKGLKLAVESPDLPPLPIDAEALEHLEVERGYMGFAVTTFENGVSGKLHIPKQTLQAGFQLYIFFQQMQMQQKRDSF